MSMLNTDIFIKLYKLPILVELLNFLEKMLFAIDLQLIIIYNKLIYYIKYQFNTKIGED